MEIRKPRQTIPVKNLNVKNFVSPGRVFGEDLMGLMQDSLVFNQTEQIVAKKVFLGGLEVEDLRFTENNPLKATIARFQEFLTKDFNYTGNVNFAHELSVKNLHSSGGINGFQAHDLQKVLLSESNQIFTAPQSLHSMKSTNLQLISEMINGQRIPDLFENSYWLDKEEELDSVRSSEEVVVMGGFGVVSVNGIPDFENRPILNSTSEIQRIQKMRVKSCSLDSLQYNFLNGFDKELIMDLVGSERERSANLNIFGNAVFEVEPNLRLINGLDVEELAGNTWLSNEDVVLTGNNIFFQDPVRFDGNLSSQVSASL
jgi:hypothetical protein